MADLIVKVVDVKSILGGKAVLLCDEEGNVFPTQTKVDVSMESSSVATVTVTFAIDGENVRFE